MSRRRRLVLTVLIGGSVTLAVGGWAGLVLGPVVAVGVFHLLSRTPAGAAADRTVTADLPFIAELLAAALRSGAAPELAARCVARAVDGPTSDRLTRVDLALSLGAPADEAWGYLGEIPGARRIALAATRTQASGAAFAGALQRLAEDLRADRLIAADAAGRRAGVLIVLPLGLCFLPAFLLAGLVPVIVAILGDVLAP